MLQFKYNAIAGDNYHIHLNFLHNMYNYPIIFQHFFLLLSITF